MRSISTFVAGATSAALVWVLAAGAVTTVSAERAPDVLTGLPNVTRVVDKAGPAVVAIQVEQGGRTAAVPENHPMREFFRRFGTPRTPQRTGQGSGVIVDRKGHVLTNAHVVRNATKIRVRLHDGRTEAATLVGADPQSDLAVLKIEAADLTPARIGSSERLKVGEWVVAIGTPFGLQQTVTAGIVSAKGRSHVGLVDHEDFIQTDAAINPGNSGGPLLNLRGEVVGINSAIFSRSGGNMGIGFAIPADLAQHVLEQLTEDGRVSRGYLGVMVSDVTPDLAGHLGLRARDGAVISVIQDDSAAKAAGLQVGDVVLTVNRQRVTGSAALRNAVALIEPGRSVSMTLIRDGERKTVEVTLGTRPAGDD